MRKNKGLFLVLATLLAVTCLLVSCNSEVSENATGGGDKLVYATFGKGNTKALTGTTISTSYKLEEIGDVYWFYKASKADQGGRSGAQSSWYPVIPGQKGLDGVIGPFSTGLWNFEVIAYKDCSITAPTSPATSDASVTVGETTYYMNTAVFAGSVNGVSLATGTQANPDPINVTVTLQTSGSNGILTLDRDFVFEWAPGGGGTTDLTLKAVYGTGDSDYKTVALTWDSTSSKYVISSESETQWAIPAGDYEFDFEVYYTLNNVQYTVATASDVALKVYGGQETIIKASILEGNFVYAKINATVKSTAVANTVTTNSSTTFVTSYTPASVSSGSVSSTEVTTVEFPANALKATGSTATEGYTVTSYALDVAVTDIDASQESTFTVADTTQENVVASIDLTLTMTQTSTTSSETTSTTVSSFDNNGVAAVTTYIAKKLTDPVVYYNGTAFTAATTGAANTYTYDSTSGRLVIYTDHFSEFYVSSKDEAYNATTGTAYAKVKGAVDAAVANQTIKLLKNCTSTDEALEFNDSGVTFDLNGKTLTVVRTGSTKSIQVTSDVTFKNGAIVGTLPSTNTSSYVAVYVLANGDLTIEDVDIAVNSNVNNESHYAVAVLASGTENDSVSLTINGGTFDGMVGSNGQYRHVAETINDGTFNAGVYFPAYGEYVINGGTFNDLVEIKSGSLTVSGGSFNYASDPQEYTPYWNGTTVTGCSLAAVAYNGGMEGTNYGPSPAVTINGGDFAGFIGRASECDDYPVLEFGSGVFVPGIIFVNKNLQKAVDRSFDGDTIKLISNIPSTDARTSTNGSIKVNKSLTFDGSNGEGRYSIESGNGESYRVFSIDYNTVDISVTFKNVNIVGPTSGGYTRGVSIYANTGKVVVNFVNSSVSANYYAINIGSDNSSGVDVNISNSSCVAGWAAINSWSKVNVNISNGSTLKGLNNKSYGSTGYNNFSVINLTESSDANCGNSTITINDSTLIAETVRDDMDRANAQWFFYLGGGNIELKCNKCVFQSIGTPTGDKCPDLFLCFSGNNYISFNSCEILKDNEDWEDFGISITTLNYQGTKIYIDNVLVEET